MGLVLFVDVPTTREGTDTTERSLATPADFGSGMSNLLSSPPSIGADTEEVLRGLGLDAQELARLVKDGIVGGPVSPEPDD